MKLLMIAFIFFLSTANLKSQEITVFQSFGGLKYYEDNVNISMKEVKYLLVNNPASKELWIKAEQQNYGIIAGIVGSVGFAAWSLHRMSKKENQAGPYAGAIGTGSLAVGLSYKKLRLQREAILAYNESFDKK